MSRDGTIILAVALAIAAGIGGCMKGCVSGCDDSYSDGERAGVITKFSHKGVLIKSWEGQMNLGGMTSKTDDKGNSYMTANTWEFTVRDAALVAKVEHAMSAGGRAKLAYRQWLISPMTMESSYEVTAVTEGTP
jgi:hypothetical protein